MWKLTPFELNIMLDGWAWRHGLKKHRPKDNKTVEQRRAEYEELKRKFERKFGES